MKKRILSDLQPYIDQFVNTLAGEHEKLNNQQNSMEKQKKALEENEQNRVIANKQIKDNLNNQIVEYQKRKEQLNVKEKELSIQISEYNEQKLNFERRTEETEKNLEEIKSLKEINSEQLNNNRKIEDTYNKKIGYLKKDDARIDQMQKDCNAREKKLDAKLKMIDDKEYENAQVKIALDERSDLIRIGEKQLKIKQADLKGKK